MAITYSISGGADATKFNIDGASGALAFKKAPDYEKPTDPETGDANGDHVYEVTVRATDATGLYSDKPVKVTVTDVSEGSPPQITSAGAISVKENQTVVMTVTATDPDDTTEPPIEPPTGEALPPLVASGSITATDNQTIENKLVTGKITVSGKSNVTIKNVLVKHPAGIGIDVSNASNVVFEDVRLENTNHATGQGKNPDKGKNIQLAGGGPYTLTRVTGLDSAMVFYAIQCTKKVTASFIEGHNMRSPEDVWGGNLFQFNQCTGGGEVSDFSVENPMEDSRTGDNINLWGCTGTYVFRRGLIDGNNNPSGCGLIVEGTSGVLFEDIDLVHMQNGGPAAYSSYGGSTTTRDTTFRRVRTKDTVQQDVGRGPPKSNYLTYSSSPGTTNTRYEQCKHWNVKYDNLAYDQGTMTAKDWKQEDFTPRAPIRNRTPGT